MTTTSTGTKIHVIYPLAFWGHGPRETCYNICSHWPSAQVDVSVFTAANFRPDPARILSPALPMILPLTLRRWLAAKPAVNKWFENRSLQNALAAIRPGDWCYVWPGTPLPILDQIKGRGGRIVLEFINCHTAHAKAILDDECDRVGAPRHTHLTPNALAYDADRVARADAIFAPGPFVGPSIRAYCALPPPILDVAYGAHAPATTHQKQTAAQTRRFRFLFVGSMALRKGLHVLLDAWKQANLDAELWIAGGSPEPWITENHLSDLPDTVRLLGHRSDIAKVYQDVDAFVFPSLEEGGPQVTYEAATYGLPLIVTPMGGGRIAAHEETALLVPPSDPTKLAEALVRLHGDRDLRGALAAAALERSAHFHWPAVAQDRIEKLLNLPQ